MPSSGARWRSSLASPAHAGTERRRPPSPDERRRQAARYCCHTSGTFGTATCTKIVEDGGAGFDLGCMFACFGSRSPLRRLHVAQQVTTLSQDESPPLERGITWSTV